MKRLIFLVMLCLLVGSVQGANYLSAYDAQNVLLLQMNQSPAHPAYFNDSAKNKMITTVGDATTNTSVKYLGNASGYFDGSGDYLSIPISTDFQFGTGDFTIVAWVKPNSITPGGSFIFDMAKASDSSNRMYFQITSTGTNIKVGSTITTTTMTTTQFSQIVVSRSSGTTNVYINGTLVGTDGTAIDYSAIDVFNIGARFGAAYTYYDGYMDSFSVWKGVAIPISELYPQEVEIQTPSPSPVYLNYYGSPTSTTIGTPVIFNDTSIGNPTSWAWFFGDERYNQSWNRQPNNGDWIARLSHYTVTDREGGIVLMGGTDSSGVRRNDVWRSVDSGAAWTQQTPNAPWSARDSHVAIITSSGKIIMTGGQSNTGATNDTWTSIDSGKTWVRVNASGGWTPRYGHTTLLTPNGHIILFGGTVWDPAERILNDTWRSVDEGATWQLMNASSGWEKRQYQTGAAFADGSIIMLGGMASPTGYAPAYHTTNDTWQSVDEGVTWAQINASSGWSARGGALSQIMPDNSVITLQGVDNVNLNCPNDVWRSTDQGYTWSIINTSAGWVPRWGSGIGVTSNGDVVLSGGRNISTATWYNDSWKFSPSTTYLQNTTHSYSANGVYNVSLIASNDLRYNSSVTSNYIIIEPLAATFTPSTHFGITYPNSALFTDTSTGNPTEWNWTYIKTGGGGSSVSFNTTQNATFFPPSDGVFFITLNASTATEYSISSQVTYVVVTNASGYNQQDLTMSPQFTLTVNIVDSSTLLPIPIVTVIDNLGYNTTTSTGTFTHDYEYQTVVLYLSSSGYDGRAVSYVMDSNRTETVTLTATLTNPNDGKLNLLYPHEVQFTLADSYGHSLSDVNVTAYMTSSSVSNTNWYSTLFGISTEATPVNSTMLYAFSDDSGSFTMPMISSGRYTMTFTSVVRGISESRTISPQQANYIFILTPTASLIPNMGDYINGTLYQNVPNTSYVNLIVYYTDLGSTTGSVSFFVNAGNGTRLYTSTYTGSMTTPHNFTQSVPNLASVSYVWGYYANSSQFGNVSQAQGIMMKGAAGKMLNLDPCGGYATGWGNEC